MAKKHLEKLPSRTFTREYEYSAGTGTPIRLIWDTNPIDLGHFACGAVGTRIAGC